MGFLGKLFGAKPDAEKMRRALAQRNFVEALHIGEDLQAAGGADTEVEQMLVEAADGLARRNLEEGERLLAAGEIARAKEHLQLAGEQARSSALLEQIKGVNPAAPEDRSVATPQKTAAGGCGGCASAPLPVEQVEAVQDAEAHFELLLASYPEEMRANYQAASADFRRAVALIHEGEDAAARNLLEQFDASEQDSIYRFELGSLYARQGLTAEGRALLEQALLNEPANLLFLDALLAVQESSASARQLLEAQAARGADAAFCQARLCELSVRERDFSTALALARKALAGGYATAEFLVLAASLLEQAGVLDEAERLLSGLPGGGCGGGINLHLAEFWLRQKRELGRVLDAFNGACRQEPENPRWQLRVAQTYLARSWKKQGFDLLRRVVSDPRLDEPLRLEAESLLAGS